MKHALVIGGSGMLSAATLWLVKEGYHVSVIGRNQERLDHLKNQVSDPTNITTLSVDYRQEILLKDRIGGTIERNGPLELVVAWIHSPFKKVLAMVAREAENPQPWRLFHVIGSGANHEEIRMGLSLSENCSYRQVQLGFILDRDTSRWLTHEEISNGVIESIAKDEQYHLIGVLEPENRRPY
jgi:hypothetical protein